MEPKAIYSTQVEARQLGAFSASAPTQEPRQLSKQGTEACYSPRNVKLAAPKLTIYLTLLRTIFDLGGKTRLELVPQFDSNA